MFTIQLNSSDLSNLYLYIWFIHMLRNLIGDYVNGARMPRRVRKRDRERKKVGTKVLFYGLFHRFLFLEGSSTSDAEEERVFVLRKNKSDSFFLPVCKCQQPPLRIRLMGHTRLSSTGIPVNLTGDLNPLVYVEMNDTWPDFQ